MSKGDIAEKKSGVVAPMTPFQRYLSILDLEASDEEVRQSSKEISARITEQMFLAETLEEAIAIQDDGPPSGKDLEDVEMELRSFEVVRSEERFRESSPLGFYVRATDNIRLDTLEPCLLVTGAPNIVNAWWKARNTGRLPMQYKIGGKDTGNGRLLTFHLLPKRAIRIEPETVSA